MGRVERRKQETRQRIFDVACTLFKAKGYKATTMDEVAEQADVAKGTIFNYFSSKEHLLAAYYQISARRVLQYGRTLQYPPSTKAIRTLVAKAAEEGEADPLLIEALVALSTSKNVVSAADEEGGQAAIALYEDILKSGVTHGEFRADTDIETFLMMLNDVMSSTAMQWVTSDFSFALKPVLLRKVDFLLAAIVVDHNRSS